MTSRDFVYWLQGYFEITDPTEINEKQTDLIKKHLNLVFKHEIDPSMGDEKHQQELNSIHNADNSAWTDDDVIKKFGPKPSSEHLLSTFHGWYHPKDGIPRC